MTAPNNEHKLKTNEMMKQDIEKGREASRSLRLVALVAATATAALLQACAAPPPPKAPDISTDWKPMNQLAETAEVIPLKEEEELHKFQMLPTDVTLRSMMQRWADENGGELDWQYPSDLTLVSGLKDIKENNLNKAVVTLRKVYAPQKLRVRLLSNKKMIVSELPG